MKTYFTRALLSLLFLSGGITLFAKDEYLFDLDKPPSYATEWFDIVKKDIKASEMGTIQMTKKAVGERGLRFVKKLAPSGEASCETWAAYRFAEQKFILTRFPNFDFLNRFRNTAKEAEEVNEALWPWRIDGLTRRPSMMVTGWALSPPSVSPTTKPEDVRKLRRYVVRLAVEMRRHMADSYDPNHEKNFSHGMTPKLGGGSSVIDGRTRMSPDGRIIYPEYTSEEKETNRIARKEEAWKENMTCIHHDIFNTLQTMDSALCSLFRSHVPGDKVFIKEMLIEAGFKTPEQRKAYWQFCRTQGANWANWKPEDEQRLVTD